MWFLLEEHEAAMEDLEAGRVLVRFAHRSPFRERGLEMDLTLPFLQPLRPTLGGPWCAGTGPMALSLSPDSGVATARPPMCTHRCLPL